jgi:hypothetical protein
MKKSLVFIMGLLIGALLYGELLSNDELCSGESYLVINQQPLIDDQAEPLDIEEECDCRESEDDECFQEECLCQCHERIEIE